MARKSTTNKDTEPKKDFDPANEFAPTHNPFKKKSKEPEASTSDTDTEADPEDSPEEISASKELHKYVEDFNKTGKGMSPAQSEATWSRVFELRKDIWKQLLHIPEVRNQLFTQLPSLYGKDIRPDSKELEGWSNTIGRLKDAIANKTVSASLLERVSYELAHSNEALMQGAVKLAQSTNNSRTQRINATQHDLSQLKEYIVYTISRMVAGMANKWAMSMGQEDKTGDLFTDGMRGVLKAIDKYDPSQGPFPALVADQVKKQFQGSGSKASQIVSGAKSLESPTMGKNNEQGKDTLGDRMVSPEETPEQIAARKDVSNTLNKIIQRMPDNIKNYAKLYVTYRMIQDLTWEDFAQALLDNHDMGHINSKTGIKEPYTRQALNKNFNKFKDAFLSVTQELFPERYQYYKASLEKADKAEKVEPTTSEPMEQPRLKPRNAPEYKEPDWIYADKEKEDKPVGQHFSFESLHFNNNVINNKLTNDEYQNGDFNMARFQGWLGNGKKLNENMNNDFEDDESESEEDLWGEDEEDMWEDEDEDDEGFGESEYDIGKLEIQSEKYPDPEREGIVYQTLTYDGNEIGVVRTKEKTLSSTKRSSKFNMGGEGFKQVDYMLMAPKSPEYIENASWEPTGDPNIVFVVVGSSPEEVVDYLSEKGLPKL